MNRAGLYRYADGSRFAGKSTEEIFSEIAEKNIWFDDESISGVGSSLVQTAEILKTLPELLDQFQVRSLFDVPCGDFNWFQKMDLSNIKYTGADIVKNLITQNKERFRKEKTNFIHFNLLEDDFDAVDLIFCRDCLVHFSIDDIFKAIANIKKSNSTYLLTTHFPEQKINNDIQTGGWRPLNFEKEPFNFKRPIYLLNEKCTEMDFSFADKSLSLWRVSDL